MFERFCAAGEPVGGAGVTADAEIDSGALVFILPCAALGELAGGAAGTCDSLCKLAKISGDIAGSLFTVSNDEVNRPCFSGVTGAPMIALFDIGS